jgi:hypothetical protein
MTQPKTFSGSLLDGVRGLLQGSLGKLMQILKGVIAHRSHLKLVRGLVALKNSRELAAVASEMLDVGF